ncbi:HET-domain-containing protein [Stipitochalara longipes BDJ]|nr:HET-domain-containing protein [Stipitochalara longipes BDJ]
MPPFSYDDSAFNFHDQIRLLTLLPRKIPSEKLEEGIFSITTLLEPVNWTDKPPYIALSYTWGNSIQLETILVNGQTIDITIKLFEALRELQSDKPVRLWVDAICINQKDDLEKSEQVKHMTEIYKAATSVFAWLGPSTNDSDEAIDAIEWIGEAAIEAGMLNLSREVMLKIWDPDPEGVLDSVRQPFHALSERIGLNYPQAAIKSLAERSYWNRTWIAQEFSVASDLIIALTSQTMQATDPRDKIFGLLGLAPDAAELGIKADYKKEVNEVFTDTAKTLLQNHFTDVLSWCRFPKPDLPSWVPDFRLPLPEPIGSYQCRAPPWKPLFHASGTNQVKISMGDNSENTKTLTMSGLSVDTIEELGKPWDGEDESTFLTQILHFCDRAQALPQPISTDPQFWDEVLWRLPCADQQWHEYTRRRAQPGAEQGLWEIFARMSGERSGYTDEVKKAAWTRYYLAMQCLHSFRPFISKKGYIGLAPASAIPGDIVCVIFGAIVPYILRRVSDKGFELVGEAYVHGIMDGEAIEIGLQEEEFCLF